MKSKNLSSLRSACIDKHSQFEFKFLNQKIKSQCIKKFISLSGNFNSKDKANIKTFVSFYFSSIMNSYYFHDKIKGILGIFSVSEIETLISLADEFYEKSNLIPRSYIFADVKDNSSVSKRFYNQFPYLDQKNTFFKQDFKKQKRILFSNSWKGKYSLKRLRRVNEFVQFISENDSFLNPAKVHSSILKLSSSLTRQKYYSLSNKVLETILGSQYSHDLQDHFYLYFKNMISLNDYNQAFKKLDKFKVYDHFDFLEPKFKFWITQILEKNEEQPLRNFYLNELISEHPLNFYSIVAHLQLRSEKKNPSLPLPADYLSDVSFSKKQFSQFLLQYKKELQRILAWSKIGNAKILSKEVRELVNQIKINHQENQDHLNQAIFNLIHVLNITKDFLTNFSLIQNIVYHQPELFHSNYLNYLFPQPFKSQIKKHANDSESLIITSLMRQESAFNPKALSSAGAKGLMQLMPATARTLARIPSSKVLYKPKTNIKLGVKFLKKLLKKYEGNIVYSLSAYNAGQRRVKNWKRRGLFSGPILQQIENIPFDETRKYVKLILRNMFFYQLLNKEKPDIDPVKSQLNIKSKV